MSFQSLANCLLSGFILPQTTSDNSLELNKSGWNRFYVDINNPQNLVKQNFLCNSDKMEVLLKPKCKLFKFFL